MMLNKKGHKGKVHAQVDESQSLILSCTTKY